jgi:hypothetical protein
MLPKKVTLHIWISVGTLFWRTCSRYSFAKKFTVTYPDLSEWKKRNIQSLSKGPVWFTEGSKTSSGTGGCVFGGKTRLVFSLGAFATVFQAEVFAIMAANCESIVRGYNHDLLTARLPWRPWNQWLKPKLILKCLECLSELATHTQFSSTSVGAGARGHLEQWEGLWTG